MAWCIYFFFLIFESMQMHFYIESLHQLSLLLWYYYDDADSYQTYHIIHWSGRLPLPFMDVIITHIYRPYVILNILYISSTGIYLLINLSVLVFMILKFFSDSTIKNSKLFNPPPNPQPAPTPNLLIYLVDCENSFLTSIFHSPKSSGPLTLVIHRWLVVGRSERGRGVRRKGGSGGGGWRRGSKGKLICIQGCLHWPRCKRLHNFCHLVSISCPVLSKNKTYIACSVVYNIHHDAI